MPDHDDIRRAINEYLGDVRSDVYYVTERANVDLIRHRLNRARDSLSAAIDLLDNDHQ